MLGLLLGEFSCWGKDHHEEKGRREGGWARRPSGIHRYAATFCNIQNKDCRPRNCTSEHPPLGQSNESPLPTKAGNTVARRREPETSAKRVVAQKTVEEQVPPLILRSVLELLVRAPTLNYLGATL